MFKVIILLVLVSLGLTQDDKSKENETITKLDLSNKGLTSLNDYDFTKYPQLEELDLSNNLIENIKEDKFTKNKNLKKLNLSGNTELKLPEFSTLLISDIEELDLSNCNIEVFPPSILDGLIHLKVINLSNNPLSSIKLITFTNLLSPEKIILPNLDDKKTITEICQELNITIEDIEKSLPCADVRNDKWEGIKKETAPHLNVDTPVSVPNSKEHENSQSDIIKTETQQVPVTKVNLTNNEENIDDEKPPNVPEETEKTKDSKHETDAAENPEANDGPNMETTNDKKTPETAEPKPDAVDTEPAVVDTQPDAVDIQPDVVDSKGVTLDNDTNKAEVPKTPDVNNETNSIKADDKKPLEIPQPSTNQATIDKVNTKNDVDSKTPAEDTKVQQTKPVEQPVSKLEDEQIAINKVQVAETSVKSNDPNAVVSNNNEVQASKETVQTPESSKDQEKLKPVPVVAIQRSAPVAPPEFSTNREKPEVDAPIISIQRAPIPPEMANNPAVEKVNQNSRTQDVKQAQKINHEGDSEASTGAATSPSTGTNILIFLVVAVVISGIAAFGYRFYKTRTYRTANTQEPIERELQEIVVDKKSNGPNLSNVLEEEPLMKENENSVETKDDEGKEKHTNHASTNSKPYIPITSIITPEDTKEIQN